LERKFKAFASYFKIFVRIILIDLVESDNSRFDVSNKVSYLVPKISRTKVSKNNLLNCFY